MQVSREELLHIANLASLKLKEEEIDNYLLNLQDRKDEIQVFEDNELLISNAPEAERNMFKIPKVL